MLKIGNSKIGKSFKPKIIAEISANHNQSLKKAIELIKKASKNGSDFVKIQSYQAENITLNSQKKDFIINDKKSIWYKKNFINCIKLEKLLSCGTKNYLILQKKIRYYYLPQFLTKKL